MKIKVGINGMGRIGRMIIRSIVENNYSNFEINSDSVVVGFVSNGCF